jgi:hypothetical protein
MANQSEGSVLPLPPPSFNGTVGKTCKDSKPDFPQPFQPPKDAPNVLLILVDDLGFGGTASSGGLIRTPNTGDSVSSLYEAPFRFTGKILNVTIEPKPQAPISEETAKKTEERAHAVAKIDRINAGRGQLPSGRNHWCPS